MCFSRGVGFSFLAEVCENRYRYPPSLVVYGICIQLQIRLAAAGIYTGI